MRKISIYNPSTTLSKSYIRDLKLKGNGALTSLVKDNKNNSGNLIFIFENLGQLPHTFDAKWVVDLLSHKNENVRYWSVKTLGKLHVDANLEILFDVALNDESTIVKREAVSSIGRMRTVDAIPKLKELLSDEDPKIVCQAVRGLLVFKGEEQVDEMLKQLADHENEMVRAVIRKEYYQKAVKTTSKCRHQDTYNYLKNVVVNGDVRDVLQLVPDESFHLTFTSPPYYNARDYSIYKSYEAYLQFLTEVFREVYRTTKEGRFLIVNTSPIIIPRISRAHSSKRYPIPFDLHYHLTQIGWEFIDDIIWEKPEYSVKNRIGGFQQHRKPLAYKPNTVTEYLMVYRKHSEKLLDWNIHQYDQQTVEESKVADGYETTNIWKINPKSDKIHSAVFPFELCQRVIDYYSYKGDLIFDPFGGSGTLGRTAKKLQRSFFLTEKEPKYFDYMKSLQSPNFFQEEYPTSFLTLEQFKQTLP